MPSLVEHSKLLQFTDDTTGTCPGENHDVIKKQSNSDLLRIQIWFAHWNWIYKNPVSCGFGQGIWKHQAVLFVLI